MAGGVGRGGPTKERGRGRNSGEGAPQLSMQFARLCGLECEKSELPDVKVPGCPGGLPRAGPGPASWAQPSCSSPAPPHSTEAWDITQHPGLWFLYTSLCGLCLAMYSYPKINTLGVLFLLFLYLSSWASPWPTFEGLKGGRGLFCRPWRVGGLLLMMLVLVMWTEIPVIGDNISLVLYKPGAAWEVRAHRAAPATTDPGRRERWTRVGCPFFLLILTSPVRQAVVYPFHRREKSDTERSVSWPKVAEQHMEGLG